MIPMTATKSLKYAGRVLSAGEDFDAKSKKDAAILSVIGAKYRTAAVASAALQKTTGPATELPAAQGGEVQDEAAALRVEYETLFGKRPFMGWGADTLREKIAAKKAEG
jgi:hypothetical protein